MRIRTISILREQYIFWETGVPNYYIGIQTLRILSAKTTLKVHKNRH
jgi:hypothetical protein